MNLKRTKGYRFIGVLLIICMVVTGVPGICYASEEKSPEQKFRELYYHLLETGDNSVQDISDLNLPYMTCYRIMYDVRRKEGYVPFQSYKEYNFIAIDELDNRGTSNMSYLMKFHLKLEDEGFQERYRKVKEIIAKEREQLDEKMTDLDKLLWFHEYVVENLYYKNTGNMSEALGGSSLVQGYAICAGYERALMLFLKAENIPCEEIGGGTHGWLAVQIDGKWYHVDPTWDDTSSSKYGTHYFLMRNDDEFENTLERKHDSWSFSDYPQQDPPKITIDSTDYTDWYVHKVWNRKYYYDGYWYYVLDNAVRKNNIQGTKESILYEGKNLKINGLEQGVLKVSSAEGEKKFDLKEAVTPTPTVKLEVTVTPTVKPEVTATVVPTVKPEVTATVAPTVKPEVTVTVTPTVKPEVTATVTPTVKPEVTAIVTPTAKPEVTTTVIPTAKPEVTTIVSPTVKPEVTATVSPTVKPEITSPSAPTEKPKVTVTPASTENPKVTSIPKPTPVKNDKKKSKVGKPTNWSLTNQKGKKLKILLKKKVTGAKGYEVVYSTDKRFKKYVKRVRFTGKSKLISKLKKNKIYYVKVRAYKKDSKGKYVFGAYSNVQKIRIKK